MIKEYDFTDVSLKEREQDKKWYKTDRPCASLQYGPTVTSSYTLRLKWNPTTTGGTSKGYQGDLIGKREESEAGAAM